MKAFCEFRDSTDHPPVHGLQINSCGQQQAGQYGYTILRSKGRSDYHLLYVQSGWITAEKDGAALTANLPLLEDTDGAAVAAQQEKTRALLKKLPLAGLDLSAVGAGKTKELFDRPEWKQLSESCLGCGTCTFVCPTCQCYDIKEFDSGRLVRRFRCWDSCMYSDFTKMSAGQPRPTQLERFRQRFMHKLVYFPDNNDGCFGCVGCGRCLAKCPIHMNIVKVIKTLGEEHA